jgi:hypothetical protein
MQHGKSHNRVDEYVCRTMVSTTLRLTMKSAPEN